MGLFNLFKKKEEPKQEPIAVKEEPKIEEKPKPKPVVWQTKRERVESAPGFIASILDDFKLIEDVDFDLSKKELMEDHEGETVWQIYPNGMPFELDGENVIVTDLYDKKVTIGTISPSAAKLIKASIAAGRRPDVAFLGGKYKKVTEEGIETGNAEWSAWITYEKKRSK